MTPDRIIKQAMRPHRASVAYFGRRGRTETEEASDTSNLRFRAYEIIMAFSFFLLFHFSFRPSLFPLFWHPVPCAAVRIDFASWQPPDCHSIFAFACAERERSLCRPSGLSLSGRGPSSAAPCCLPPHLLLLAYWPCNLASLDSRRRRRRSSSA